MQSDPAFELKQLQRRLESSYMALAKRRAFNARGRQTETAAALEGIDDATQQEQLEQEQEGKIEADIYMLQEQIDEKTLKMAQTAFKPASVREQ